MTEKDAAPENRFSRWSKQKQKARQEQEAIKPSAEEEALAIADLAEAEKQHLINRETAEAVDLDSLDDSSDFSIFMKDGVPDDLRRKAYRLLWRTNPILANVDGLNDYDEDFADASMIMKSFKSAWDVTKGYDTGEKDIPEISDLPAEELEEELEEEIEGYPETEAEIKEEREEEEALSFEETQSDMTEASIDPIESISTEPEPQKISLRDRLKLGGEPTS